MDFQWLSGLMQSLFALFNQPLAQRRKLFIVPDPALRDLGTFFFDPR
ncbi:MAG: hypothetical protein ABW346_00480 [Terrimicrobium sp.]